MEKLLIVCSQESERKFEVDREGRKETVKAIDLVLTDGINNFLCTAYEKEAQRLIDKPLEKGSWVAVDLSFSVKTSKTEKGDRAFQQIRINKFCAL